MAENIIYELEVITDDPKFEGFAFVRKDSLRGRGSLTVDFFSDNIKTEGRAWTITRMTDTWTPQPVIGRVRSFNDYPCVNLLVPALSRRAVDGLRDLLEANGELLPLAWKEEDRKEPKKKVRVSAKRDREPVTGNTVVLLLPITRAKPNKAEKQRLAKLMDEINALLYDPAAKPDDAYSGNLEGDDLVAGELRFFLSCPDADVLVEKLRPWLKTISWNGTVKVLKRYGELADIHCREEYVEL